jgi:hypothetical protein
MKIEHDQHGRVDGVDQVWYGDHSGIEGWVKEGAMRFASDGWREVQEKWQGDVTSQVQVGENTIRIYDHRNIIQLQYCFSGGYRFKKERSMLPMNWKHLWDMSGNPLLLDWIDDNLLDCLIVTKDDK